MLLNILSTESHFVTLPFFTSSCASSIPVFFTLLIVIEPTPFNIDIAFFNWLSSLASSTVTISCEDDAVFGVLILLSF